LLFFFSFCSDQNRLTVKVFSSLDQSRSSDGIVVGLVKSRTSILESGIKKDSVNDTNLQSYKFNYEDDPCFGKSFLAQPQLGNISACPISHLSCDSFLKRSNLQQPIQNKFLAESSKLMSPLIVQEILKNMTSNACEKHLQAKSQVSTILT